MGMGGTKRQKSGKGRAVDWFKNKGTLQDN